MPVLANLAHQPQSLTHTLHCSLPPSGASKRTPTVSPHSSALLPSVRVSCGSVSCCAAPYAWHAPPPWLAEGCAALVARSPRVVPAPVWHTHSPGPQGCAAPRVARSPCWVPAPVWHAPFPGPVGCAGPVCPVAPGWCLAPCALHLPLHFAGCAGPVCHAAAPSLSTPSQGCAVLVWHVAPRSGALASCAAYRTWEPLPQLAECWCVIP